jgi:hypothetical protein
MLYVRYVHLTKAKHIHKTNPSSRQRGCYTKTMTVRVHSELISFWTLSIVQYSKKLENTTFRKLDLFPSSGHGGGNVQ